MPTNISNTPKYKPMTASAVFIVLATISFLMLNGSFISEPSFIILIFLTVFTSFTALCLDRIKILKFKEFQLTLFQIKETETSIKDIALATVEVARLIEKESLVLSKDGKPSQILPAIEKLESLAKKVV